MNIDARAKEFFETILNCRRNLSEIPKDCFKGEAGVLFYLAYIKNDITPSELSDKINVSLPRIVSVLNSLESKEMINKKVDNKDKRKILVEITNQGLKYIENKKTIALDNLVNVFNKLKIEEIEEYIRLTKKITNIINDIHINENI